MKQLKVFAAISVIIIAALIAIVILLNYGKIASTCRGSLFDIFTMIATPVMLVIFVVIYEPDNKTMGND